MVVSMVIHFIRGVSLFGRFFLITQKSAHPIRILTQNPMLLLCYFLPLSILLPRLVPLISLTPTFCVIFAFNLFSLHFT